MFISRCKGRWSRVAAGMVAVIIGGVAVAEQGDFASTVAYFTGHKYILTEDYSHRLSFNTGARVASGLIELEGDILFLRTGFGRDGTYGPAVDTKDVRRASAVHDAVWDLMKARLLDSELKEDVDREFATILEADGMPSFRRWYLHKAVSNYGSVSPSDRSDLAKKAMKTNATARRFFQALSFNAQAFIMDTRPQDLMKRLFGVTFSSPH